MREPDAVGLWLAAAGRVESPIHSADTRRAPSCTGGSIGWFVHRIGQRSCTDTLVHMGKLSVDCGGRETLMDPLRRTLTDPQVYKILQAINLLRLLDREVPAQVVAAFFYVASHNDCHKTAMEEDLNFSAASGSRNSDWLSEFHRLRKPGMGLITKTQDPANRRRQQLRLTPKGEQLIHQIKEILFDRPSADG